MSCKMLKPVYQEEPQTKNQPPKGAQEDSYMDEDVEDEIVPR